MIRSLRIRDRPGVAFLCLWVMAINSSIALALSPALPRLAAALGRGADGAFVAQFIQTLPAVAMVFATTVAIFYSTLRRALGFRGIFLLVSLGYGLGLLVCVSATGLPLFMVGTALLGVGAGLVEPTLVARALELTAEPLHDRAAGATMATNFAGQFLNPLAIRPLAAIGGINFAAASFGLFYLGSAALLAVLIVGARGFAGRRVSARG